MDLDFSAFAQVLPAMVALAPGFVVIYAESLYRGERLDERRVSLHVIAAVGVSSFVAVVLALAVHYNFPFNCQTEGSLGSCLFHNLGWVLLIYAVTAGILLAAFAGIGRLAEPRQAMMEANRRNIDEKHRRDDEAARRAAALEETRKLVPHGKNVVLELRDQRRVQGQLTLEHQNDDGSTLLLSITEPILLGDPSKASDGKTVRLGQQMQVRSTEVLSIIVEQ